jgi:predicted peroxiredoxin
MATILYTSTYGTDDPTRATLPFLGALGALEAGHQAQIILQGEATYLMKDYLAEQIHGVGWPPLTEILTQVIDQGIPIYV